MRVALFIVTFALAASAYFKALVPDVPGPRAYWWIIHYETGLIRRGLLGTVLTPIRDAFPSMDAYRSAVMVTYHVTALLVLLAMLGWALAKVLACKDRNLRVLGTAIILLLAASPFVSNQAYNSGWLDVYLMGVGTLCFALVRRGWYAAAAAIASVMMFVHEFSLFFWLPSIALMLLHLVQRRERSPLALVRPLLAIALPVLAALLIGRLETRQAVEAAVHAMAIDDYTKDLLLREQFTHTPLSVFLAQVRLLAEYPRNFAWASVYALLPSVFGIVVALAFAPHRGAMAKLLLAGIGLSTWAALAVNWDVTRTMSLTAMSALLVLAEAAAPSAAAELPPRERLNWGALAGAAAAVLLALGYARTPLVYAYFQVADVVGPPWPSNLWVSGNGPLTRGVARAASLYSLGHERDDLLKAAPPVRLSCNLSAAGEKIPQEGGGCAYDIGPFKGVWGPYRRLRAGKYVLDFQFASTPECSGTATVEVIARGETRHQFEVNVAGNAHLGVVLVVSPSDEVMRPWEFRTLSKTGCLRLTDVVINPS